MELWQANKFFEKLFDVSPDLITILVVGVCIALFIFSLPFKKLRDISPALMLSAGIIGTFWGTFIALSDFQTGAAKDAIDHNAMVASIPMVLSGMKSAFVTSLIGLLFAFVSKVVFYVFFRRPSLPIDLKVVDLLEKIKDGLIGENDKSLSSQLDSLRAEYRDSVSELKKSISGDSESSVSSQLRELRNENEKNFKNLDSRLEGLSEVIRKSLVDSINSLIEELKDAITNQLVKQLEETNKLLSKQLNEMLKRIENMFINEFGKTLRQFNEATQAIKKWQEEHRQHVEELTEAFKLAATGIEKIRADCESIPATMEALKNLMGELDERLKAFAEMKQKAEESFPVIKEHLEKIGNDLKESAEGFNGLSETIQETYTEVSELAKKHIAEAQRHIENVGQEITKTAQQVASVSGDMVTESGNAGEAYRKEIRAITDEVQKISQRCVQETQEVLTQMAEKHAKTINDTMTAIANKWGANMVGIADEVAKHIKGDR